LKFGVQLCIVNAERANK